MGENIGTVARAMLNFGLTDLRLVSPRSGWQMERAIKASAGAEALLENHRLFETVNEATADLGYVVATTARQRDMVKPVVTPAAMAGAMRARQSEHHPQSGILFGC
ncbi:MAG: TrmH family RNA methyltransferase, partial [Parvibaculales bacterium]